MEVQRHVRDTERENFGSRSRIRVWRQNSLTICKGCRNGFGQLGGYQRRIVCLPDIAKAIGELGLENEIIGARKSSL